MNKLSIVIATKNEEKNIRKCLESVKWADEIIIVDDKSADRTVEICREYTDKIFLNDSRGSFHKNKNLGIEKTAGDWILSLDADERVTPELKEEILVTLGLQASTIIGYCIPRKNYFLGKWIRGCGWWPDYIIRLFKKGVTQWPLDIHATPKIKEKNKVGYLQNPLIHYSYRNLNQYFEKFNSYTSRLAQEEFEKGIKINKRNFFICFLIKPLFWVLHKYFFWKGYRDAFQGFFISFSSALVVFITYAKLWEKQNAYKKGDK